MINQCPRRTRRTRSSPIGPKIVSLVAFWQFDCPHPAGLNRYPTQGSVTRYRGLDGSASSFLRSWPMNTRRYSGCSCDASPHTASSSVRCVEHAIGMPREVDEQIEFLRRQPHFVAARCAPGGHRGRSRKSPTSSDAASPASAAAPAERRAHARQQFVGPERLGHVVVGARVERLDLRPLLAFHRQHDDRHARHRANPAAQLDTVHARHVEVGDHQLRMPLVRLESADSASAAVRT